MSARPSQDCPLLAGVGVPDLDGRVGAARRYQVGPGRIVPNGGGLLHVRLEGVKRFGGQDDAHGTEHPLPLPVNVFVAEVQASAFNFEVFDASAEAGRPANIRYCCRHMVHAPSKESFCDMRI